MAEHRDRGGGTLTDMEPDLAEEIGVHFGNGYLFNDVANYHSGFDIYGNLYDDYPYLQYHVTPILKRLYGVQPRVYVHPLNSTVLLRVNSEKALQTKRHVGVPIGRKIHLHIPRLFLPENDTRSFYRFVRGLFDIEGTVRFRRRRSGLHTYPVLECELADPEFIQSLYVRLRSQGLAFSTRTRGLERARISQRRKASVYLSGWHNLNQWLCSVGLMNAKHLTKLLVCKTHNFCPPWTCLDDRLSMIAGETDPESFYLGERGNQMAQAYARAHELLVLRMALRKRSLSLLGSKMKSRRRLTEYVVKRLRRRGYLKTFFQEGTEMIHTTSLGRHRLEHLFEGWKELEGAYGIRIPESVGYHPRCFD